jgi:hypothetical protein
MNRTQCDILINSSLGCQCQVLLINVKNRMNNLQLIQSISHLRSLQYHLPSTCSIARDLDKISQIRLWIK